MGDYRGSRDNDLYSFRSNRTGLVATYTCSVTGSTTGTYGASFVYPGNSNYNNVALVNSSTTTAVSKATPTVSVTANSGTATIGSSVIFTATVTGPSGGVTPTGAGTWSITGVTGITTCSTNTGPTGSSNVATYTCSAIASKTGTYGASFTYPGDTNYLTGSDSTDVGTTVAKANSDGSRNT